MQRHTKGILYVFKVVGDDVYKVGFTTKEDPSRSRLPNVQTGNHEDVEFVHMWPGTLGEELDLHQALAPYRARLSGKGEWYRFTVGSLLEAISGTRQALYSLSEAQNQAQRDFDKFHTDSPVSVCEGPYKAMSGFYSQHDLVPLSEIPSSYHSYAIEHYTLDAEGQVPACQVFLYEMDTTVWLPPVVLSHEE